MSVQTAAAQPKTCSLDTHASQKGFVGSQMEAADYIAHIYGVSVSAEIEATSALSVSIVSGDLTLRNAAILLGANLGAVCSGTGVLYIYSPKSLNSLNNALNYRFGHFKVAKDVGLFRLDMMQRLADEGWREKGERTQWMLKGGEGGVSSDADLYPLVPELLDGLSAREILFRIGSKQQILSDCQIFTDTKMTRKVAWEESNKTWFLDVVR